MSKVIQKNVFFENDFIIDREHIAKTVKRPCLPYERPLRVTNVILLISAILFICVKIALHINRTAPLISDFFTFVMLIVAFLKILSLPAVRIGAMYRQNGNRDVAVHIVFEDDAFMDYNDDGGHGAESYYHINSVADDGDAFVLNVNRGSLRIPKSSFTYGDPGEFLSFMKERTANSKKVSYSARVISVVFNIVFSVVACGFSLLMILSALFPAPAIPVI